MRPTAQRDQRTALKIGRRGSTAVGVLLTIAVALLASTSPAVASRPPTPNEAGAISRALHASRATGAVHCFHVHEIVISTAGPWARARIFPCSKHGDRALAVLELKHHRWRVRDLGTADTGCTVAPRRVRRDLRLFCG